MGECASVEAEHLVPLAAARAPDGAPGLDVGGLGAGSGPCALCSEGLAWDSLLQSKQLNLR